MDYKFTIILGVIVILTVYIYVELNNINNNIDVKLKELNKSIENQNKSLRLKFQSDLTTCANKLKTYNAEFITQARKINVLNTQPITNISNHFSDDNESDDVCDNQYLSDVVEKKVLVDDKNLYMSETTNKSNDFKINYNNLDLNENTHKSNKLNKSNKSVESVKSIKSKNSIISVKSNRSIDLETPATIIALETPATIIALETPATVIALETPATVVALKSSFDTKEVKKIIEIKPENNNFQDIVKNIDFQEIINNLVEENIRQNSPVIFIEEQSINESDTSSNSKHSDQEILIEEIILEKKENDNISVNTVQIQDLTKDTFSTIDKYNKKTLDNIARVLSLPITYKQDNKRFNYKKEELYNNIKNHLEIKNK